MEMMSFSPHTASEAVGKTFTSGWFTMDQKRITEFGHTTEDLDPAHIDPDWCKENSPWGTPIAFGFLTVSMLARMAYDVYKYPLDGDAETEGYPANYGFNKLRLIEPVHAGERIRGHFTVREVAERKPGQQLITLDTVVEIEGKDKPALVAEWLSMWIMPESARA